MTPQILRLQRLLLGACGASIVAPSVLAYRRPLTLTGLLTNRTLVLGVCARGISDVSDDVMKLHFWH